MIWPSSRLQPRQLLLVEVKARKPRHVLDFFAGKSSCGSPWDDHPNGGGVAPGQAPGIIAEEKNGRPGQAPERRKESLEWENSQSPYRHDAARTLAAHKKKPRRSGALSDGKRLSLRSVYTGETFAA